MQDITAEELKLKLDNNEKFHFIDVREQWEFDEYNLGATLIPLGDLQSKIDDLEDWKNEEIIIHCKSGARSGAAKNFMVQNGFTNVRNLIGGALGYKTLE
ncbi:MAG: rhodanese-like domain-containing protein [Bacteroidetes bacterium]|nr:rhodanese-like domain-containing protein [Bacteroidota bacterium]